MEETLEKAPKVLGTMLDYLGLDASVKSEERNGNVHLTVFSEEAGRIIGRKGQSLQSLQLLLNRIISKGKVKSPRLFIDVDGYRKPERGVYEEDRCSGDRERRGERKERRGDDAREDPEAREARIRQQALDTAKEVKRWGEPATLSPMSGRDRRFVHLALEDDPEIATESATPSDGDERYKSIVISLKK
ncbi:MAG: KH domain-containing protein [Kiritimatiellaeota bacterium]|nr:KH domain-containing protein [Kiritimatiellota bacterium]